MRPVCPGVGCEGAGGALDHDVVLAAVVSAHPGYGGARPAHLETGDTGYNTENTHYIHIYIIIHNNIRIRLFKGGNSKYPDCLCYDHLVVVTLVQAMLQ